eukprot:95445_1
MSSPTETKTAIPEDVQQKLKHQFLVIRQEAITKLVAPLKEGDTSSLQTFQDFAFKLLSEDSWQSKQSAFILCTKLIEFSDASFHNKVIKNGEEYFEYKEHRVREAVATCMGEVARCVGIDVYHTLKASLFRIIYDNFDRDDAKQNDDASGASSLAKIQEERKHQHQHQHDHIHDHGHSHDHKSTSDASELRHDTEGWKCLFSAMKTIERMIVGLGKRFEAEVTKELLALLNKSTQHINRFIREVTYYSYAAICNAITYENSIKGKTLGDVLSQIIAQGLSDNWSQVRYASSHALMIHNMILLTIQSNVNISLCYCHQCVSIGTM